MRHTTIETVKFTRIRYSCDVCQEKLLEGAKPTLCSICQREAHWSCMKEMDYGSLGIKRICFPCNQCRNDFLPSLLATRQRYDEDISMMKADWKQVSLRETEKREES